MAHRQSGARPKAQAPRERIIYRPGKAGRPRRFEWVELADGSSVCIWELMAANMLQLISRVQRHPQDPRGGIDEAESLFWQIAFSCHDGEPPTGKRIFPDELYGAIHEMTMEDIQTLLNGIARVNGMDSESQRARELFGKVSAGEPTPR